MLSKKELLTRIHHDEPIIRDYRDLDVQLQQCGVDIRLNKVWRMPIAVAPLHVVDFNNELRYTEKLIPLNTTTSSFDNRVNKWFNLIPGHYLFQSIENMWIPPDLCAISSPRSTLTRTGAIVTDSPLFDPGYLGPDNTSIIIPEPGMLIMQGARYTQMVFFQLTSPVKDNDLYDGIYNEKLIVVSKQREDEI